MSAVPEAPFQILELPFSLGFQALGLESLGHRVKVPCFRGLPSPGLGVGAYGVYDLGVYRN